MRQIYPLRSLIREVFHGGDRSVFVFLFLFLKEK